MDAVSDWHIDGSDALQLNDGTLLLLDNVICEMVDILAGDELVASTWGGLAGREES